MKITENKQSKLRHYIGAPKRFLRRARDLYVDSMLNVDCTFASANVMTAHISNLPKDYGRHNLNKWDDHENLQELYRSISRKYNWTGLESDKGRSNLKGREISGYGFMDRSYSIALGKIGTINEEEPCDFQEDVTVKGDNIWFPRSRSHAVARKNVFY